MNLIRTKQQPTIPVSADTLEPFRILRNMLRWDPYREIAFPMEGGNAFMPSFDVKETADAYIFTADMPGIQKEDLDVQLAGNRLTISGHRETEETKESERFFSQERSFGTFNRTFSLPEEVDSGKVVAELRDGVLHLMVPKSPETRPQKIAISHKK
jgi:HSP20 family protein